MGHGDQDDVPIETGKGSAGRVKDAGIPTMLQVVGGLGRDFTEGLVLRSMGTADFKGNRRDLGRGATCPLFYHMATQMVLTDADPDILT
jgi:hypothetical protein